LNLAGGAPQAGNVGCLLDLRWRVIVSDQLKALLARLPRKEFTAELSDDKVADFHARGFTLIERITTDEEVMWLREVYDLLFSGTMRLPAGALVSDVMTRLDEQRGNRIGQFLRPELFVPALKETQFHKNSRRIARQLLGRDGDLELFGHMIRKEARNPDVLPWHQDEAYWDPQFEYQSSAYWMPLDPATRESGCMSFIPGSHKRGVRRHAFMNGDPSVTALAIEEDIDASAAVLQPVPIGGASIHHGQTVHCSGPNATDHVRRAYINEWQAAPPLKREMPYDRPWYAAKLKAIREHRGKAARTDKIA
jgi:hypothetical protein